MRTWEEFEGIVQSGMDKEEYSKHILTTKIATSIIKMRLDKGWTQKELAEHAELQQSAIARIESEGVLPRLNTLLKILGALEARFIFQPDGDEVITIESITEEYNKKDITFLLEGLENKIEEKIDSKFNEMLNRVKLNQEEIRMKQNLFELNLRKLFELSSLDSSWNFDSIDPQHLSKGSKDYSQSLNINIYQNMKKTKGVEGEWDQLGSYVHGLTN